MKKRKRDIFTFIEAVPNWFEAGEGSTTTSERGEEDTNWAQGREGPTESVAGDTVTEVANWASGREGPVEYVAGTTVTGVANWASGREGPSEYVAGEVAIRAAHVAQGRGLVHKAGTENTPRSEVQPQSTLTAEVNEWLIATRPPDNQILTEPEPVTTVDLDDTRSRALNAFWSLFKAASYEEW